ncbi:MAG: carbon-nitrogen hydrolase family protein, partial [Anaerovoracaceae bacterium]
MDYTSDIINLAVVNFRVASGEKEVNLRRMMDMSRAASRRGADLILFPEMALTGYGLFIDENIPQDEKVAYAETVEGPSVKALEEVAKDEGMYIVFGMPEKLKEDDNDIYNSAVVLGPDGLVGSYQKIHPYGSENMWCKRGEEPFMFDTKWGPISLGVCYDNYQFPELARYYAWKGSRLHLNPTFAAQEVPNEGAHHAFI